MSVSNEDSFGLVRILVVCLFLSPRWLRDSMTTEVAVTTARFLPWVESSVRKECLC